MVCSSPTTILERTIWRWHFAQRDITQSNMDPMFLSRSEAAHCSWFYMLKQIISLNGNPSSLFKLKLIFLVLYDKIHVLDHGFYAVQFFSLFCSEPTALQNPRHQHELAVPLQTEEAVQQNVLRHLWSIIWLNCGAKRCKSVKCVTASVEACVLTANGSKALPV